MTEAKIEHKPHRGARYGREGKPAIAIMGYSHHGNTDNADFTTDLLSELIAGDHSDIQFFKQIAGYFGDQGADFWNDVAFFNFGARLIGSKDQKNDHFRGQDYHDSRDRFTRILSELEPDMLFVFTRRGWTSLPTTEEWKRREGGDLIVAGQEFDRQHYILPNGKIIQAFGLRHPERATKDVMREAVTAALKMKPTIGGL